MAGRDLLILGCMSPFIVAEFAAEAVRVLVERDRPVWPWSAFCTCPEAGGPAGDYEHHRRDCFAARHFAAGPENPKTGWVYVGR